MVNRNRPIVRTPRRRKIWAGFHTFVDLDVIAGPTPHDLLDQTATDLGMSNLAGVTVMRVVGYMQLVQWVNGATTPALNTCRLGMAWNDQRISTATGSSGLAPRPAQLGTRDSRWYQQWVLQALEQSAPVVVNTPLAGTGDGYRADFDIRNMQKAPTADSKFNLWIMQDPAIEEETMRLQCEFDILLALP